MPTTRELFEAHVNAVLAKAEDGDDFAIKTLACMALLAEGFPDGDGDGGGEVVDLREWRQRIAA